MRANEPEHRAELVDGAVRGDPQSGLGDAPPIAEARLAGVAAAGIDAVEPHDAIGHGPRVRESSPSPGARPGRASRDLRVAAGGYGARSVCNRTRPSSSRSESVRSFARVLRMLVLKAPLAATLQGCQAARPSRARQIAFTSESVP